LQEADEIKRYLLTENDLVMSLTGNVGRVAMLSQKDLPAALNQRVACLRAKKNIVYTRYLFHFFDQPCFENEALNNATGGGQKNLGTRWLSSYQVPIPCPDKPEKSLAIQAEIVRILDAFTAMTSELTSELNARQKQYNYYRDLLLSEAELSKVGFEWKTLGEVAEYSKSRISYEELDENNYVGVDNLLQNRAGKTSSNHLPTSGNLTHYVKGDVLIGNIRP